MKLLRKGAIVDSPWLPLGYSDHGSSKRISAVPLQQLLQALPAWEAKPSSWVALIEVDDNLADLPPIALTRAAILVDFPTYTDGRGYSHARTLRQQYAFRGELVAVGDVRRDQLEFMRLVGFDSYQCAPDADASVLQQALTELRPDV